MSEQMNNCVCSRNPYPADLREEAMNRAEHECEECGRGDPGNGLEIHYTWTHPVADVEEYDVRVLCRDCHVDAHFDMNGDFWDDATEKESHWHGYFEEMGKD